MQANLRAKKEEGGTMADSNHTPPPKATSTPGGQSMPRIYYYKTKHYRPELQQDAKSQDSKVGLSEMRKETQSTRPADQPPPLEPGEEEIQGTRFSLSKENLLQLSFFFAILFLAIWWVFFFTPADDVVFPSTPQTPTTPTRDNSQYDWERRLRIIAQEEANLMLSDKIAQVKRLSKEIEELKTTLEGIDVGGTGATPGFTKRLDALTDTVNQAVAIINKKLQDVESKTSHDLQQKISTVTSELRTKITVDVANANSKSASTQQQVEQLHTKLGALQKDFAAIKEQSNNAGSKITSVEATIKDLQANTATKESVAAVKSSLEQATKELDKKLEELVRSAEERITSWIKGTITEQWVNREVLKVLAAMPPKTNEEVAALTAKINGQRDELVELVKKVNGLVAASQSQNNPADKPTSPQEALEKARPEIRSWIKEAISTATPDIVKSVKSQLPSPTKEELFEQQKKLIEAWLEEKYLNNEIPALIAEANQKVSSDLQGKVEGVKSDLVKMEERLSKQAVKLDGQTKDLIIQQLRAEGVIKGLTTDEVLKIVEAKVDLFAADRVNMTDYALETGGAKIITSHTSPRYREGIMHWLGGTTTHSPTVILTPVGSMRGKCWSFKGDRGFVTIQLPFPVEVSAFTLEHISRSLAVTPGAAPRTFRVLGLQSLRNSVSDLLGEYEYILGEEKTVQTFPVQANAQNSSLVYSYIVLDVSSNYGNPEFTCVYRFRVHGKPAVELEGINKQESPVVAAQ